MWLLFKLHNCNHKANIHFFSLWVAGRLNGQNWAREKLTDGHTPVTVSIDYGDNNNAPAKWRRAGGAPGRALQFAAAGKGRGGAEIWHMTDGLSIASEEC